jgi:hypothetical protein
MEAGIGLIRIEPAVHEEGGPVEVDRCVGAAVLAVVIYNLDDIAAWAGLKVRFVFNIDAYAITLQPTCHRVRGVNLEWPSVWQGRIPYYGSAALCSTQGAEALQTFFAERVRNLEGGPHALAQSVEGVKLCTARVARHQQH